MKNYFSISEAAKLVNMTSETLRHYDRIGLVKPSKKDNETKYRYYSKNDIIRLKTIQSLRYMSLSLKEIKKVLEYDNLEEIVDFLTRAEKNVNDKIAELQHAKSIIKSAKIDYEKKLKNTQESKDIFIKHIPERFIFLSNTMKHPCLDNLWNYHKHFYDQIDEQIRHLFKFEDLAGIYTENESSRLFAVCIRHTDIDGLKGLPEGTYLCANCTEENKDIVLENLMQTAKYKFGVTPQFTVQLIVISGILHWNYQIQIYLGINQYLDKI